MLIRIERSTFTPDATLGVLFVNGSRHFVTREDPLRSDAVFVPGETCLPAGLYNLTPKTWSRRFGRDLPLIVSTQPTVERRKGSNRCGMFFHPGEPELDLGGEILLGISLNGKAVTQTAEAFAELSAIIGGTLGTKEAIEVEIN